MTAHIRKSMASLLALVWMLCISHGLIDMSTAHWHQLPTGEAHHHHHHAATGQHTHAHDGPSGQQDPHSNETACCEMNIRVTQAPALNYAGPILMFSALAFEKHSPDLVRRVLESRLKSLEDCARDYPPPESRLSMASVQTPNSPPPQKSI